MHENFSYCYREEELSFDDLAFFDSALYTSFAQLLTDAFYSNYSSQEFTDLYDMYFEVMVGENLETKFYMETIGI